MEKILALTLNPKTSLEIKEIARIAVNSGSTITLRNADAKTTLELKEIARIAKQQVTFEI